MRVRPLRVVVADDNVVVRRGLVSILMLDDSVEVVGEASEGVEALEMVRSRGADLAVLDVRMPGADGIWTAGRLGETCPVLFISYSEDAAVVNAALEAGGVGYLVHGRFTPEELISAVHGTVRGEQHLSPAAAYHASQNAVAGTPADLGAPEQRPFGLTYREHQILLLLASGLANAEIAEQTGLRVKTVKNNITRIFRKMGVSSRTAAMAEWLGTTPDAGSTVPGRESA